MRSDTVGGKLKRKTLLGTRCSSGPGVFGYRGRAAFSCRIACGGLRP